MPNAQPLPHSLLTGPASCILQRVSPTGARRCRWRRRRRCCCGCRSGPGARPPRCRRPSLPASQVTAQAYAVFPAVCLPLAAYCSPALHAECLECCGPRRYCEQTVSNAEPQQSAEPRHPTSAASDACVTNWVLETLRLETHLSLPPSGVHRQADDSSTPPPAERLVLCAGHEPHRVGVVRDAFAPHDAAPRALSSAVAPLGNGRAAVASAITEPHARLLVDEYERGSDGLYRLTQGSSDLLRCANFGWIYNPSRSRGPLLFCFCSCCDLSAPPDAGLPRPAAVCTLNLLLLLVAMASMLQCCGQPPMQRLTHGSAAHFWVCPHCFFGGVSLLLLALPSRPVFRMQHAASRSAAVE